VSVVIDESGEVISATVASGVENESLRAAATDAAKQARFSPTLLEGKPVKVTGSIIYNFVADKKGHEEELKYLILSMALRITRESADHLDKLNELFESKDIFAEGANDPEVMKLPIASEIKRLVSLDQLPLQKRVETIDSVRSGMRSVLGGSEKWQFDVGDNIGRLFTPFLSQYIAGASSLDMTKINEGELRSTLHELSALCSAPPEAIPAETVAKLRSVAELGNRSDLMKEATLKELVDRIGALIDSVSPD
jgi:TonB family protein